MGLVTKGALLIFVLWLSACSAIGVQQAQSFDERLAYAYGVNTAVREASVSSLNAGEISADDMQHVIVLNDQARALMDSARMAGDTEIGQSRLTLAITVLTQVQTFLRNRGWTQP